MRFRILLAIAATWFIWGSTYLAIRFSVEVLPPFLVSGLRNTLAGALLYGWMRLRGAPRPSRAQWGTAAVIGLLLLGVGNGAVTWATRTEPSGAVALVVSLVPLWLMVFGWIGRKGVRPESLEVLGVLLGLVGIALLVAPTAASRGAVTPLGLLVLLASTIAWSTGSLYSRQLPPLPVPLVGVGMEMLCGGIAMLLLSAAAGEWSEVHPAAITMKAALSLAYLVVFGSIIGFSAYKWLLTAVRPAIAGTYALVNPMVAVALGWAFAGEAVTRRLAIAMLLIVSAVAMISLRPYLSKR